jgi:hypothetical protein
MWVIHLIIDLSIAYVISWLFVWIVLVTYDQYRSDATSYLSDEEMENAKKRADEANRKKMAILSAKAACWLTFLFFLVWAWATR